MQDLIRRGFPDATVITIAHRLDTVAAYDRVMVMDGGRVVALSAPEQLLTRYY